MEEKIDRSKEIKLLHLDHLQSDILSSITKKFIEYQPVGVKQVVDAFVEYIIKLAELSASGEKHLCDDTGNISSNADHQIKKFVDAILICSKHHIIHQKILNSPEIKQILAKAVEPRNRFTIHHLHELTYRMKIILFSFVENDEVMREDYLSKAEDSYMSTLASMNPSMAKSTFTDHVVNMILRSEEYTTSDIVTLTAKYSKYLGKHAPSEESIEALVQKYHNADLYRNVGAVHSARIEIFKILEGI